MLRALGTGIRVQLPMARVLDARRSRADRPGEHLWIVMATWSVSDPERPEMHLDAENVLEIAGPGCVKCEREYSRKLARRPCTETAS